MTIAPISTGFGYYISPYASAATKGAARTALASTQNQGSPIQPVKAVPTVFPNDNVSRIPRTKEEMEQERMGAYERMSFGASRNAEHINPKEEPEKCETCEKRKYVDGSNESDVSFKAPGHIAPENAAAMVMSHEYEHVRNAYEEGSEKDSELVSVSVSLKTAICPECGRTYVAGGETRTTIRHGKAQSAYEAQQQAFEKFTKDMAGGFDSVA